VVLGGERVVLRPGRPEDVERLVQILREPEVARWWGQLGATEIGEQFVAASDAFVIEVDGEVIGAIQFGEESDPQYRHAGIDIFLTSARHRQGLGTEAIRVLARHLFTDRGHHRLSIDPAAHNQAAIRAYERVGFRRVGVLRRYELGPDGTWHDGLLMDMLAEDLRG
jgi:aminoglycoside 6'-N-acetyltransferase